MEGGPTPRVALFPSLAAARVSADVGTQTARPCWSWKTRPDLARRKNARRAGSERTEEAAQSPLGDCATWLGSHPTLGVAASTPRGMRTGRPASSMLAPFRTKFRFSPARGPSRQDRVSCAARLGCRRWACPLSPRHRGSPQTDIHGSVGSPQMYGQNAAAHSPSRRGA